MKTVLILRTLKRSQRPLEVCRPHFENQYLSCLHRHGNAGLGVCLSSALLDNVIMQHLVNVCTEEPKRQRALKTGNPLLTSVLSFSGISLKSLVLSANGNENMYFAL